MIPFPLSFPLLCPFSLLFHFLIFSFLFSFPHDLSCMKLDYLFWRWGLMQ